jgi:hypothetical protein
MQPKRTQQLDKYKDKLFADPITVPTPNGTRLIQPQRTNNLMERFFVIGGVALAAERATTPSAAFSRP